MFADDVLLPFLTVFDDMSVNAEASQLGHSIRSPCDNFTILLLMFIGHGPSGRPSQRGIFIQKRGQDAIT